MRKATKVWLIAAASLVLIGCMLFVGVMFATGWDFSKLSTVGYETNTHEIAEPFRDHRIDDRYCGHCIYPVRRREMQGRVL